MNQIQPQGQSLRQAIKWVSEQLKENENQPTSKIVNKAVIQFDLSPKDSQFLMNMYRKN